MALLWHSRLEPEQFVAAKEEFAMALLPNSATRMV